MFGKPPAWSRAGTEIKFRPHAHELKLNFDGSIREQSPQGGWGSNSRRFYRCSDHGMGWEAKQHARCLDELLLVIDTDGINLRYALLSKELDEGPNYALIGEFQSSFSFDFEGLICRIAKRQ